MDGIRNLITVYNQVRPWEKTDGYAYYDTQRLKLQSIANKYEIQLDRCVGAFAALSPNNSEKNTYIALATCIQIALGKLPETTSVVAYPNSREKALKILRTGNIELLQGPKTKAFYWNTLEPDNSSYVTVDGHMVGCWNGKVATMKSRASVINATQYTSIANDIRSVATCAGIPAPRMQSVLWIVWKRLHGILVRQAMTTQQTCLDWDVE